jgi:hypothetical protein
MPRQLWIIVQFSSDPGDENPPRIVSGALREDEVSKVTRGLPQGSYEIMRAETRWCARVDPRPAKVKKSKAA